MHGPKSQDTEIEKFQSGPHLLTRLYSGDSWYFLNSASHWTCDSLLLISVWQQAVYVNQLASISGRYELGNLHTRQALVSPG